MMLHVTEILYSCSEIRGEAPGRFFHGEHAAWLYSSLIPLVGMRVTLVFQHDAAWYSEEFVQTFFALCAQDPAYEWFSRLVEESDLDQDAELLRMARLGVE